MEAPLAFAAVYLIWGTTYLAVRFGVRRSALLLAGIGSSLPWRPFRLGLATENRLRPFANGGHALRWRSDLRPGYMGCFFGRRDGSIRHGGVMMARFPELHGLFEILILRTQD